jgi:hypothetical protein
MFKIIGNRELISYDEAKGDRYRKYRFLFLDTEYGSSSGNRFGFVCAISDNDNEYHTWYGSVDSSVLIDQYCATSISHVVGSDYFAKKCDVG